MGSEWKIKFFDDTPLDIIDGDRGKNYPNIKEISTIGHCLFLNAGNVTVNGFDFSNCVFISKEKDAILRKGKLVRNDVVLTTRGTVGNAAFYNNSVPFKHIRINSGMVILRSRISELLPRYLFFFVRSPQFRSQLLSLRTGSAQPQLPIRDIKRIQIPLPPLLEQRAIAHILGSLDDKIELNRRMNKTLEAIARAIFKSWFIDFDPVIDNALQAGNPIPDSMAERAEMRRQILDQNQPSSSSFISQRAKNRKYSGGFDFSGLGEITIDEIYGLFPDSFQDSELGPIPKGWEVVFLPKIIDINPVRTIKRGQIAPYLEMRNIPEYSARVLDWYNRAFGSGTKFINGDTLMARITPCLENGKGAYVDFLKENQVGWGSTEYIVFRAKKPLPLEYSYFLSRTKDFRSHAIVNMTGSSGRQRVPVSIFESYRIVKPSEKVAECYGIFSGSIMQKIKMNDEESYTLASLRDTLLPKLISGELRIPDVEKFLKET